MTRQFATLQNAHVPLDECLKALTEQVENVRLSATLAQIKDSVSEGRDLSVAMKDYPDIFSKLYVNMVAAGESAGTLGLVLDRVADFLEYRVKVRGQIISAITYPLLMMFASSAVVLYLFLAVVPKLSKVFADLKVDLPWYTKLLVDSAQVISNYWFAILAVVLGVAVMVKRWVSSENGKKFVDKYSLKAPFFGGVVLRISVGQFTETLSTLLNAGVPIVAALDITKNVVGNTLVQNILEDAKDAVQEGESLGKVIEKSEILPPLVVHMVKTGEKTGQLEQMLKHVSDAYDTEVQQKIAAVIALIEPLMVILMMGATVVIIMAIMIPMLGVMNQVRG